MVVNINCMKEARNQNTRASIVAKEPILLNLW